MTLPGLYNRPLIEQERDREAADILRSRPRRTRAGMRFVLDENLARFTQTRSKLPEGSS